MATISLTRLAEKGRFQIYLRISANDRKKHFAAGIYCNPESIDTTTGKFKEGKGIKAFDVDTKDGITITQREANRQLESMLQRANAIKKKFEESGSNWTIEQFEGAFRKSECSTSGLLQLVDDVVEDYEKRGKHHTAQIYAEACQSLASFISGKIFKGGKQNQASKSHISAEAREVLKGIAVADINAKMLKDYIAWCEKRGNSQNTIGVRLRGLRTILNIAVERGVITEQDYGFGKRGATIKAAEATRKDVYLTIDQIRAIKGATINNPVLDRARHMFVLSFLLRGMNHRDMAELTAKNLQKRFENGRNVTLLTYIRAKTHKPFEIEVTPEIQTEFDWFKANTRLINGYLLPIYSIEVDEPKKPLYLKQVLKRTNAALREVCRLSGVSEEETKAVTFYAARHSFAMGMLTNGKEIATISKALGHANTIITQTYLRNLTIDEMTEATRFDL